MKRAWAYLIIFFLSPSLSLAQYYLGAHGLAGQAKIYQESPAFQGTGYDVFLGGRFTPQLAMEVSYQDFTYNPNSPYLDFLQEQVRHEVNYSVMALALRYQFSSSLFLKLGYGQMSYRSHSTINGVEQVPTLKNSENVYLFGLGYFHPLGYSRWAIQAFGQTLYGETQKLTHYQLGLGLLMRFGR
jgi:hypothetical protein